MTERQLKSDWMTQICILHIVAFQLKFRWPNVRSSSCGSINNRKYSFLRIQNVPTGRLAWIVAAPAKLIFMVDSAWSSVCVQVTNTVTTWRDAWTIQVLVIQLLDQTYLMYLLLLVWYWFYLKTIYYNFI